MRLHPVFRAYLALQAFLGLLLPFAPAQAADDYCRCKVDGAETCFANTTARCDSLLSSNAANPDLKGATCESTAVDAASCKTLRDAATYKKGQAGTGFTITLQAPVLNIPIPGLRLDSDRQVELGTGGKVEIPYLAQYIAGVYRYLLGISLIAAAIMIIYGGFLYVLGSTMGQITSGKQKIQDAIIGIVLLFGSVTLLDTINSNLIGSLKPLTVEAVKLQPARVKLTTDTYKSIVGGGAVGNINFDTADCTFAKRADGIPTASSAYDCAVKMAEAAGIHPCYAVIGINHESQGVIEAVGYNSDKPYIYVQARLDFLRSKKMFSGQPFEAKIEPDCNANTKALCEAELKATQNIVNDDKIIDRNVPGFGLDPRFTHDLGILQVSVSAASYCQPGVPSTSIGGKCYTAKDLLSPGTGIEAALKVLISKGAGKDTSKAAAAQVWNKYIGVPQSGEVSEEAQKRGEETERCAASDKGALSFKIDTAKYDK